MKKITILLVCTIMLSISCNKTDLLSSGFKSIKINSQLNETNKNNTYNSITINGVTIFEDMLHFEDFKSYNEALKNLEELQNKDIDLFNSLYIDFSLEEIKKLTELQEDSLSEYLENIENQIGFSESGIYEQFEGFFEFNSLRSKIVQEEEVFLNNPNPNWEMDPDNHYVMLDEERTLLNQYSEIRIGNSIFKLTQNFFYEIDNADYTTLLTLRGSGYSEAMTNVNKTEVDNSSGSVEDNNSSNGTNSGSTSSTNPYDDCKQTKFLWNFEPWGNKKLKWRVGVNTWWGNNVIAKSVNYKLTNNKWKKYKTYCKAMVFGSYCPIEPTPQPFFNSQNPLLYAEKPAARSVVHKFPLGNSKVPNNGVKGQHYGAGVNYFSSLTW